MTQLFAEGRRAWAAFEERCTSIPSCRELGTNFRHLIAVETGSNPYTYYPFLFSDAFPSIKLSQLRHLSVAALFLLHHVLLTDDAVDEGGADAWRAVMAGSAFQLRAWQSLCAAFGKRPCAWPDLLKHHDEYSIAVAMECLHHRSSPEPYAPEDLIRVVAGRCAVAKIIPSAMCAIAGQPHLDPLFGRSQDHYWLAESLLDDMLDWKRDLETSRYSYLLTRAMEDLGGPAHLNALGRDACLQAIGKHLYGSGFLDEYLQEIVEHFGKAKDAAQSAGSRRWLAYLDKAQAEAYARQARLRREIRSLGLEQLNRRYSLGRCREDRVSTDEGEPFAPTVLECARRGADFLLRNYHSQTGFPDFMTEHGCPNVWVSAHAGCALQLWRSVLHSAGEAVPAETGEALDGLRRLLLRSRQGPGWPASHGMPNDADTTAWALRFLLGFQSTKPALVGAAAEHLCEYQRADGGFSRFLPEVAGRGFRAWAASHADVTAVAMETLAAARIPGARAAIECAAAYLRAGRSRTLWRAYWFEGAAYAAFHSVSALVAGGFGPDAAERSRIGELIVERQSPDGHWGEGTRGRSASFETALAVRALLRLGVGRAHHTAVVRGLRWLLLYQLRDGSWGSDPVLRLPPGGVTDPWNSSDWRIDDPLGFGVLLRDHRRFFTTSMVLPAILDFLTYAGNRRLIASIRFEKSLPAPVLDGSQ
jgi:hypothetical protein